MNFKIDLKKPKNVLLNGKHTMVGSSHLNSVLIIRMCNKAIINPKEKQSDRFKQGSYLKYKNQAL